MEIVLGATLLFFITLVQTYRTGLLLPAFFLLCYMLPFLPLLSSLFGTESLFWTSTQFLYSAESMEVSGLSQVWLVSSVGAIFALSISRVHISTFGVPIKVQALPTKRIISTHANVGYLFAFVSSSIAILLRYFIGSNEIESSLAGIEFITCLLILVCWSFVLIKNKPLFTVGTLFLSFAYASSQIVTGDRDFFIVVIALMLIFGVLKNWKSTALLGLCLFGVAIVLFATLISIIRMNVEVSVETILAFTIHNSWNAAILPVILMIQAEWETNFLLYGKSYLDLILSIAPSPLYSLFGSSKPINSDNPAFWFYIEGLGGMHASGVALRNFGLLGVFVQTLLWVLFLSKVEMQCKRSPHFWNIFLYLCLTAALMHAVWYSLVTFLNALTFFVIAYSFSKIFAVRRFRTSEF